MKLLASSRSIPEVNMILASTWTWDAGSHESPEMVNYNPLWGTHFYFALLTLVDWPEESPLKSTTIFSGGLHYSCYNPLNYSSCYSYHWDLVYQSSLVLDVLQGGCSQDWSQWLGGLPQESWGGGPTTAAGPETTHRLLADQLGPWPLQMAIERGSLGDISAIWSIKIH